MEILIYKLLFTSTNGVSVAYMSPCPTQIIIFILKKNRHSLSEIQILLFFAITMRTHSEYK